MKLSRLAAGKKPFTFLELEKVQSWLDADWESHDIDRDAVKLINRLLLTIRQGIRRETAGPNLSGTVMSALKSRRMRASELYKLVGADNESYKRQVDDEVWKLMQNGKVRISQDSFMEVLPWK